MYIYYSLPCAQKPATGFCRNAFSNNTLRRYVGLLLPSTPQSSKFSFPKGPTPRTKSLLLFVISSSLAACTIHHILSDFIITEVFVEGFKCRSCTLCSSAQPPDTALLMTSSTLAICLTSSISETTCKSGLQPRTSAWRSRNKYRIE